MGFWEKEVFSMTIKQFTTNLVIAAVLILVGILLGKIIEAIFRKLLKKADIDKVVRKRSFIELLLVVVKWSIYLIFLNFALVQLDIPGFTEWATSIILVIPALTGALILIGVGFAIASYLKEVIEESRVNGWEVLSQILFLFVLYVFMAFAIKTALISFDKSTVNTLLLIMTGAVSLGLAFWYVKQNS